MKESSKHEKETVFKIDSFAGGLNQGLTTSHFGQGLTELYDILNMQYFEYEDAAGEKKVGLRNRRGTTQVSTAALPAAAAVKACYYYKTHTQYILATATKLYYLGSVVGALDPIEIGTISGIPTFTEFNGKLIIHDSGTTKAWDGTTFETLDCTYEDENIGTGDGAEVSFSGTIANPTVTGSSLTITATDTAGNTLTVTDDGAGMLTGSATDNTLLEDDCSDLAEWTDADDGDAATTQVTFDSKSCFKLDSGVNSAANDDYARIYQDVGAFDSLTKIEIDIYPDLLGTLANEDYFRISVQDGTSDLLMALASDGLHIYSSGSGYTKVGDIALDTWQTVSLIINWSTLTVDVELDGVSLASDVDFSFFNPGTDGVIDIRQYGYATNNCITYIDNINIYNGNMVIYSSGVFNVKFSAAPVSGGSVLATYKQVAGAPKSKGGFVRSERLYMWGSSDYPSRLFYSGTSDTGGEYEWDTSSGGGYLDFDKDDGYAITTCINFSQSVIVMKENKAGRLDNFPGDSIFRIEPLNGNIQCNAWRSACLGGGIIAYQSPSDISAISPEGLYDENQQILSLTKKFQRYGKTYNGAATQIEYYPTDGQLWIALGTGSTATLSTIYIIDVPSGRTTQYTFSFTCTCMKYIDGKMLLGSTQGGLYQFNEPTFSENNYLDNSTPKFQTGALDFGFPMNDKISKEIYLRFDCSSATLGTLTAYADFSSTASLTKTLPASSSVHSDDDKTRLRYRNLSIKVTGIQSANPISIYGIYIKTAVIGE